MIVTTAKGYEVSLDFNDKGVLFDSQGRGWYRCSAMDKSNAAGYALDNHDDYLILTRSQLTRVCLGNEAMQNLTTVAEMREFCSRLNPELRAISDNWNDQAFREVMIEADDAGRRVSAVLTAKLVAARKELHHEEPQEKPQEGTSVKREVAPRPKRPPRGKLQPGGAEMVVGESKVMLTPKQVEFLERLSEAPGWDGPSKTYIASEYAMELSDTMNAMSVGAVLTTLREKGVLTTRKCRVSGVKSCEFQLTEMGVTLYEKLSRGEV